MGGNNQKLQAKALSEQQAFKMLQEHVYDPNSKSRDTIADGLAFLQDFAGDDNDQLEDQDEDDLFSKLQKVDSTVPDRANFVPGSDNEVNLSTMCVDMHKLADQFHNL